MITSAALSEVLASEKKPDYGVRRQLGERAIPSRPGSLQAFSGLAWNDRVGTPPAGKHRDAFRQKSTGRLFRG